MTMTPCPHCGVEPWLVVGAFRLHVACENEACEKRPRGRKQAVESMAISTWNCCAKHGGLIYDREETLHPEPPPTSPLETVGREASEDVSAAPAVQI